MEKRDYLTDVVAEVSKAMEDLTTFKVHHMSIYLEGDIDEGFKYIQKPFSKDAYAELQEVLEGEGFQVEKGYSSGTFQFKKGQLAVWVNVQQTKEDKIAELEAELKALKGVPENA